MPHRPPPPVAQTTTDPIGDGITPIAFIPPGKTPRQRRVVPIAAIAVGLVLVLCLTALWFVFSARSLAVDVTPGDARVELHGGIAIPVADHYLLRPGSYRLTVTAAGYHDHQEEFVVTAEGDQRLAVDLEQKPGQLAVATRPEGARILVDGEDRGESPQTLTGLPAGTYQVRLNHPRHKPWQGQVEVRGMDLSEHLDVTLEPAWGLIALDSQPSGAEVSVGGRLVGATPLSVQVLEQGEPVTVKLAGHKRWERILQGRVGETLDHETIVLAPADGLLSVVTTPPGATVMVDNQYRGRSPLELELQPDKPHSLALFLDGYHHQERTLTLAAGEEQQVEVQLAANTGTLAISTSPAGAHIYVDGKRHTGGDTLVLPARPHRIEAKLDGHTSETRTITPKPGIEQQVQFTLRPLAAAKAAGLAAQITSGGGQDLKLLRPQGTFTMGSSRREQGRRANEVQRLVTLDKPFYLALTQVTNAEYKKFDQAHSSSHFNRATLDRPDQPVVRVSWQDAARYCNWLSDRDGLPRFYEEKDGKIVGADEGATGYRLATEAEWEWAARRGPGDTMRKFPWGDDFPPPANAGNYADQSAASALGRTIPGYQDGQPVAAPVRQFAANDKGLYGLGHNVAEWVHDHYGIEPTLGSAAQHNPLGPASGEFRVIRGASWRHGSITELRLSFRDYGSDGRDDLGFRIARYAQ